MDKNTEEILNEFISISEASRQTQTLAIGACAMKKRKTVGGYKWRFKKDIPIEKIIKWEQIKNIRGNIYVDYSKMIKNYDIIYQLDINTGEILNEFYSIWEAQKIPGFTTVNRCIQKKLKTAGGYKWIKKNEMTLDKIKEWEEVKSEKLSMVF